MSKSMLRNTLSTLLNHKDILFRDVLVLQKPGSEKVVFYRTDESPSRWCEAFFSDLTTFHVVPLSNLPPGASDEAAVRVMGFNVDEAQIHQLINRRELEDFIESITLNTEDDPHRAYFEMLNEVAENHKAATERLHEFMEKAGSNPDLIGFEEHEEVIEEFQHSYKALGVMVDNIARIHFQK